MKVRLWGTRGSIPVASLQTACYGGNTTCVEVRTDAGDRIILDAGTGIRGLGAAMMDEEAAPCTLCLTHAHWDHIQGLPHFAPLYDPVRPLTIMGARFPGQTAPETALRGLFDGSHFPLDWEHLSIRPRVREFEPGDTFTVGSARVETCATRHPGGCVAYRITADGWSFVFTGDHECGERASKTEEGTRLAAFMAGAEVALVDAQYTPEEYAGHRGWGHSTMEQWPPLALEAGVDHLIFTHYDPAHADNMLELRLDGVRQACASLPVRMELGYEGMRITPHGGERRQVVAERGDSTCSLCEFSRHISRFSDTGTILDSILGEARSLGNADAGTIYLVDEQRLVFAYTQNDTLFPGSAANKHIYLNASLPIDRLSIAGFVASTHQTLNLSDVRHLPPGVPYRFNDAFDRMTGYRTVSMLTVPFIGNQDAMLGVLQIINSRRDGASVAFTPHMVKEVERLAVLGANSIERARMANELILRMLQTAALRDPRETASHVMRVGAMAAEIYHRWAEKRQVPLETLRTMKDRIRMAAMLHDVGKVGIPDAILKKPGPLTPEERAVVEQHSAMGARLFHNATWDVDILARDIALHHHQKWDGTGYTGDPASPRLAGEDIPLGARVTAVADVYDALLSRRCYKEGWPREKALHVIRQGAGSHFDPQMVEAFLDIQDVIDAIHARYPDEDEAVDHLVA